MFAMLKRLAMAGLVPVSVLAGPAYAQDDDGDDGPAKPVTEITITARRLDAARANIERSLGASSYTLTNDTIESRPGGETTTIGDILLQAPGVAQDGSGALRVRQSAGARQYRINNVILPEGLTDLSESLRPRIAAKIELIKGALPAQYGFNSGGVVNITTKDGVYLNGGQAELYGGAHAELEPAFEFGGSSGKTNFFVTGSYMRGDLGLPSPDDSATPLHDRTRQLEGLAYVDHLIDPRTRIALILGASDEHFQLPNRRGLDAANADIGAIGFQRPLAIGGVSNFPSEQRDGTRHDLDRYAVLSLQHSTDKLTLQIAGFARNSVTALNADGIGDILFTGIGRVTRETTSTLGVQIEGVYELAEAHSVRAGAVLIRDLIRGRSSETVLPIDPGGMQVPGPPLHFAETERVLASKRGLFLEDEWRIGSTLTFNWGGRLDHVDVADGPARFSPRVSLVWQPRAETIFHAGYARYFLPAPIDATTDDPAHLSNTSGRLPGASGTATVPEFDDYYDVGVQREFGGLTVGVDAYWRDATDPIDAGIFGASGQSAPFNERQGRARGVELNLTYRQGRISAWGNLAVASSRVRRLASNQFYFTPAELAFANSRWFATSNAQRVTLSGGGSYRFDRLRLSGDLLYGDGLRRTAPGSSINGAELPAYLSVGLSAVWRVAQFHQRPLDLRVDLVNAFDRRYALGDGTALGASQSQWGPRRGIFAGLEQNF